jgi:hypothetical protein
LSFSKWKPGTLRGNIVMLILTREGVAQHQRWMDDPKSEPAELMFSLLRNSSWRAPSTCLALKINPDFANAHFNLGGWILDKDTLNRFLRGWFHKPSLQQTDRPVQP